MVDTHTHTYCSHDSKNDPVNSIKMAKEKGLEGFCITDHLDLCLLRYGKNPFESIERSFSLATELKESEKDIKVLRGVEIGESFLYPEEAAQFIEKHSFDFVIGSAHGVFVRDVPFSFSVGDFSSTPLSALQESLDVYYKNADFIARYAHVDTLAHITYPFRYFHGKYHRYDLKMEDYYERIYELFRLIMKRDIALEINTSDKGNQYNEWFPCERLIRDYYSMGGRLITIGSDAHVAEKVGNYFEETASFLKKVGFKEAFYYENRKPISYKL